MHLFSSLKKRRIALAAVLIVFLLAACGGDEKPSNDPAKNSDDKSTPGFSVPVEIMVLQRRSIEQDVPLTGVLQPLHAVDIIAETPGKVEKIFKKLGEKVTRRDTLARIDDRIPLSQYRQAVSQVLSAETNLKIARLNLASNAKLLKKQFISQLGYDNSELAVKTAEANHLSALANLSAMKKGYLDTRITSPIAGFISRKFIDLGKMVNVGEPVYRVVDLSRLKVEVGVQQALVSRVAVGSPVTAIIYALSNRRFPGNVQFLSPQADETTGAFTCEIHIKNTEKLEIRAGMTARIELRVGGGDDQLILPDYAIVKKNEKNFAYVVSDNVARLVPVEISENIGSQVIVESGLSEGDKIVVVGMKNLGVETRVSIESEK